MPLFEVRDLTVSYAGELEGKPAGGADAASLIANLSFSVEAGSICDVSGPSGSGKSTLFRACARMMERQSGVMLLDGVPDSQFTAQEWRRNVCLVPQQATLAPGTVRDNLLLPWSLKVNAKSAPPSDAELKRLLERALLDFDVDRDASKLSGGQSARVAFLRALVTHPKMLLLDEVDAALDDEASRAVSALTRQEAQRGAGCLRIRHRAPDGLASGALHLGAGKPSENALCAESELGQ